MWDGELGDFLRSRREALPPGAVGIKAGPRRRTPGLRRAEVAVRAGVSVEYLTRLEQGHDTKPSVSVLAAIADALLLDTVDRWHLHGLASVARGVDLLGAAEIDDSDVGDSVLKILTRLDPAPACVMDHRGHLLHWNRSFRAFSLGIGLLSESPPNLIRWVFGDRAPVVLEEWDTAADDAVAWLYALAQGDPATKEIADELSREAGSAFSRRWRAKPVGRSRAPQVWRHPDAGPVALYVEALAITGTDRLHLVLLEPVDSVAERALRSLESEAASTGSPTTADAESCSAELDAGLDTR